MNSSQEFSTPRDLANAIEVWLQSNGRTQANSAANNQSTAGSRIPASALLSLCETLYMASLATEEGEFVRVELVYIDPDQPQQKLDAPWQLFQFDEPFLFTLPTLVKLASASDPRNSALAVFHNQDGNLYIRGLIDQRDPAYKVLRREVSSRAHQPCGIFEASIEGPSNIFVHSGHELIAELNIGSLYGAHNYIDVFREGPVSEFCAAGCRSIAARLSKNLSSANEAEILLSTRRSFISTVCAILFRLQTFRHGGALLIRRPSEDHLKIRYPMKYNRLTNTLEQTALQKVLQSANPSKASSSSVNLAACEEVLDSAIWFVAVLSRVDGLVVMDEELGVDGFGAIIRCQNMPPKDLVFKAHQADAAEAALDQLDYDRFGTRHQSMMRYCFEHHDCIGFVVSEDGDARAMKFVEGRLIVWENIKLLNVG